MSQSESRSNKDLFRAWRGGDAEAGQAMAQRFADWYYAIATSRLGESAGRGPCERACNRFQQGIVEVTESRALVDWAYKIIDSEMESAGERVTDGDEPSIYTSKKRPKTLLRAARGTLPGQVALLEAVYGGKASDDDVAAKAREFGGMPLGVLKSRYEVKRWLRDNEGIHFDVAPDQPNLDRAPLPLYESGKMGSAAEEANFEKWMVTDFDLCKDIAEFAHFAIALRGGLGSAPAEKTVAPKQGAKQATAAAKTAAPSSSSGAAGKAALGGAAAIAIGIVVLLAVALAVVSAIYFLT